MKFTRLLKTLLQDGGEIALRSRLDDHSIRQKHNQSNIVTDVDRKIESHLISIINDSCPNHSILSEESGFVRKKSEYTWVIDPLDGTSNYVAGLRMYGVIVALFKHKSIILSGVNLPSLDEVYVAEKGRGAYLNEKRLQATTETQLKNVLAATGIDWRSDMSTAQEELVILGRLVKSSREVRMMNCVIDFCNLAKGSYGLVIRQNCKIWDIAGPSLILEESGVVLRDFSNQMLEYDFNNIDKEYKLLACVSGLYNEARKVIENG